MSTLGRTPRWSYSKSIFVSFYPFVDPFHSLSCLAIFSVTLAEWVTTRAAAEWQEVWYRRPGWRGRASHLISQRNRRLRLNGGALLLKHHTRHEQKVDRSQLSRAAYIVYIPTECAILSNLFNKLILRNLYLSSTLITTPCIIFAEWNQVLFFL